MLEICKNFCVNENAVKAVENGMYVINGKEVSRCELETMLYEVASEAVRQLLFLRTNRSENVGDTLVSLHKKLNDVYSNGELLSATQLNNNNIFIKVENDCSGETNNVIVGNDLLVNFSNDGITIYNYSFGNSNSDEYSKQFFESCWLNASTELDIAVVTETLKRKGLA